MDAERVNKIRDDLRPYMLRRTKDQVLNLPPLVSCRASIRSLDRLADTPRIDS